MSVEKRVQALLSSPSTPSSTFSGQRPSEGNRYATPSSSCSNLVSILENTPTADISIQKTPQNEASDNNTPATSTLRQALNSNNPHSTLVHQTPTTSALIEAKSSITVHNCVSTVNLTCELNLVDINCRTRNSEFNPSRFTGLVMRIRNPRCTALVFKTGKLVCTGARNEFDNNLAARKMARIIQKLGYNVRFRDFKLLNLVATVDLRFPIRLENLHQMHGQFSSYEPELFPGLVYRLIRPRVVLLIFVNGKIVFTGAKLRTDLTEALDSIYPILLSFRKK